MGRHETVRTPQLGERIALYACLTALTAFSIDAMLPGLPLIETALAPSPPLSTQHVISLFIFGMALGELVLGPLSDATGRKPALLAGLALYGLGTLLAVSAGSLETLVCARVLQGIGVAGPKIATRAMIRDQFAGAQMARILSLIFTLFILVPLLAPWLGQTIMMAFGWRSLFVLSLALSLMLGLWLALRHPETLDPASRLPSAPPCFSPMGAASLAIAAYRALLSQPGWSSARSFSSCPPQRTSLPRSMASPKGCLWFSPCFPPASGSPPSRMRGWCSGSVRSRSRAGRFRGWA